MPHDHHDHLSPSGHPYRPDNDHPLTYWQQMEIAVRELLVEKGVTSPAEISAQIEAMDRRSPANGARVVARAWTDSAYKQRLLADGSAAMQELGFAPDFMKLVVVENTAAVHNVVVCTLCSNKDIFLFPPMSWHSTAEQ